jgi:arylsulfatase
MKECNRPNILFIMTDQLRADGVVGNRFTKTPNLDRLSAMGTVFSSCYANAPVCVPSRFSLATGHSVTAMGIANNIPVDLNPHQTYWTGSIKKSGYQTAVIGKTHLHRHSGDLRDREHLVRGYGFDFIDEIGGPRASMVISSNMTDLWQAEGYLQDYIKDYKERYANKPHVVRPSVLPSKLYADNYVGRVAAEYLNRVDVDVPWFCWVSFGGPHEPWDAPQEYHSRYDGKLPPPSIPFDQNEMNILPTDSLHYQKFEEAPSLTKDEVVEMRINYAANISLIDDRIGEILDVLDERGCLENTLIVFTSDHGEMNGDHGLIYKNVLYEQAVKVPLIVVLPEQQRPLVPNQSCDALTQLSDIGPTVLDLVGVVDGQISEKRYATSFASLLTGTDIHHRKYIFSEVAGETMVSDGRWKLVVSTKMKPYMLFDLKTDPDERRNLIENWSCWFPRQRLNQQIKNYIERETRVRLSKV